MIDLNKLAAQFNIKDLKDLKDLDVNQLIKIVEQYKNVIVISVLVLGSLILLNGIYKGYASQVQDLHTKLTQAQAKVAAIKSKETAMADLVKFKSNLPSSISDFELIALISDYAKASQIAITSLSPAETKDMGMYDLIDFSFEAESDSFKNMMFFLRKIEKSKVPLRIDSWSGQEGENEKIAFTLKISAVFIHP